MDQVTSHVGRPIESGARASAKAGAWPGPKFGDMLARLFQKFRKPKLPELPQLLGVAEYEKLMPTTEFYPRPEWAEIIEKLEGEHPDNLDQALHDATLREFLGLPEVSLRLRKGAAG